MSKLKKRITDDMKSAMKAKDKDALKAIRMILGAIKQIEVDDRIELDDTQVLTVIQKMVKQRKVFDDYSYLCKGLLILFFKKWYYFTLT
jgi:uncharacterized protein YqeY